MEVNYSGVRNLQVPQLDVVKLVLFLLVILPSASAIPEPKLSYSETYPEARPWPGCWPEEGTSMPCFYSHNSVSLSSRYDCGFDSGINAYFARNASFSFSIPRTGNATLAFRMYECTYNPRWITVLVNGICSIQVENRASGGTNRGPTTKTINIAEDCLVEGENRMEIIGDVELGLGKMGCPQLTCRKAPLYADFRIPEQVRSSEVYGSVFLAESFSSYLFKPLIGEGANGRLTLLPGAVINECTGCELSGSEINLGPGTHRINYSLENLQVHLAFPNSHNAFLANESRKINVTVSYLGTPTSAGVYFPEGTLACNAVGGSCGLLLPEAAVGTHSIEVQAIESPIGRRGKASAGYKIDPDPEVNVSETSGSSLLVTFEIINPTHENFVRLLAYSLPEDFEGNFSITPHPESLSTSNSSISFSATCPAYSNCTYNAVFPIKGVLVSVSPTSFPKISRVSESILSKGTILLTNTNPKKPMHSTGRIWNCTEGCAWDLELAPLESRSLEYSLEQAGASPCGSRKTASAGAREELELCIRVPAGFPAATSIEYSVPFVSMQGYSGSPEARVKGVSVPITVGSSGLLISLGLLAPGEHQATISYLKTADQAPTQKNDAPETKKQEAKQEESPPPAPLPDKPEVSKQPELLITAPDASMLSEIVQVVAISGDSPAEGEMSFVSPSGREFLLRLDNGRAALRLDEVGIWKVSYQGQERSILVGRTITEIPKETAGQPTQHELSDFSVASKSSPSSGLELGSWVLLLLFIPFLAMPALGYLLMVSSRGPQVLVSKRYDGKKIYLEVENSGGALTDIWISDSLPDDAVLGTTGEGSFKKTIFGNVLKWRLPSLDGGAKWSASYEMRTVSENIGGARLQAIDLKGNQLKAASGETEKSTSNNLNGAS